MARLRRRPYLPAKIISGGQTGVDRAALDVASELGALCGGWCPRGRRAEDGTIPEHYPLRETPSSDYVERTEWNVRDADATLVLTHGAPTGGTALTVELARQYDKPCRIVDLGERSAAEPEETRRWLGHIHPRTLNVAGPRERGHPGIYQKAREFLLALLSESKASTRSRRRSRKARSRPRGRLT